MTPSFFGLDLTSSPKRPSAFAALDESARLVSLGKLETDEEIVSEVERRQPALVAIDAPLTLPLGLHCLEEACDCHALSPLAGRACERELARLGIGCYFTTKKSLIKRMVYRAIDLREAIALAVIEVYPYATKVRLFGKPIPKKSTPEGLRFLADRLVPLIPDLRERRQTLSHDACDALLAAYTAYLHHLGNTEALGTPEEGQIVIPKLIGGESTPPTLTDGVILLDGYTLNDIGAQLAGEDEEYARRFGLAARSTPKSVGEAIRRWDSEWRTGGPTKAFAMRDASNGQIVGGCEVRVREGGIAHMSWWTLSGYRNRGFASRAARLACDFAFADLGVERMELYIEPDNVASRRVATKAGFTKEGRLRGRGLFGGERRDLVLYARLPSDSL